MSDTSDAMRRHLKLPLQRSAMNFSASDESNEKLDGFDDMKGDLAKKVMSFCIIETDKNRPQPKEKTQKSQLQRQQRLQI